MLEDEIKRLDSLVRSAPKLLLEVREEEMSTKISPEKWSKKEILGHLIDSATNNHHRFVRAQFESNPEIVYDQNNWNKFNFYQNIDTVQLIEFWTTYNKQLLELIKRIPEDNFTKQVKVGHKLSSLEFLIADYIVHLEHHLKQIIDTK